jgi:hypothetical protein
MARSDAVRERLGRVILEDWFAVGKADIALQAERHGEALALAEEAVAVGQRVGSVFTGGLAHRVWAQALTIVDPGNREAMEAHMTACLRALESGEARLQMAHSQLIWGLLCFAHKDFGQAFDHWQEAAKQFETMGLGKELAKAQALIARIT